jgi:hypothetical protein
MVINKNRFDSVAMEIMTGPGAPVAMAMAAADAKSAPAPTWRTPPFR